MEILEFRSNTSLFVHRETQHTYYVDHRTGVEVQYLRCSKKNCPARGILKHDWSLTIPHVHEADHEEVQIQRFKSILRKRAAQELLPLRSIYNEEELRYREAAIRLGGFESAIKGMMVRARAATVPPLPNSMEELGNYLRMER